MAKALAGRLAAKEPREREPREREPRERKDAGNYDDAETFAPEIVLAWNGGSGAPDFTL